VHPFHKVNLRSKHVARVQPLRERLRAETARAVLDAAEQVFAEKGLREARMEEIAARAGVSVGTVYNHFEDRDALLAELMESRRKELAQRLDRALAESAGKPFEGQLRQFALTVFEHFEDHRPTCNVMLESDAHSILRPSAAMLEIRARVETLVRRGVQKKALRPDRAELWPVMLVSALKAVLVHELRNPGLLAVPERAAAAVEFFLQGART
jgi:AcrR family transcriptional regulator